MSFIDSPGSGSPPAAGDAARRPAPRPAADSRPTIHVCISCRAAGEPDDAARPGARLLGDLLARSGDGAAAIVPVECLSVCKRPCTVAFSAPGKWTYVYGDLPPDSAADTILAGAALYAAAADGIIPWKLRPDALKKGVVARIPPLPRSSDASSSP